MNVQNESGEKEFLLILNDVIKDMGNMSEFFGIKMRNLAMAYHKLTEEEQESCLSVLYELLSDIYILEINMMASLLKELKDKKIVPYIERILLSDKYVLWHRLNDFQQLRMFLFRHFMIKENERYESRNSLYVSLLQQIRREAKIEFPYIAYKSRKKKIILVVDQIINEFHAPTKRVLAVTDYYRNLGYDVECFVCHMEGSEGYWELSGGMRKMNFMDESGPFGRYMNGIYFRGYNLKLHAENYLEELKQIVCMIWGKKPEYILEIGTETILAGLCSSFTTVVTMGCTKNIPVTNAQVIAAPAKHSDKERKLWRQILGDSRIVVEVDHVVNQLERAEQEFSYSKEDFGLSADAFVIILAGSRLDTEVEDSFLELLYQILSLEERFAVAVIGECPELEERVKTCGWKDRFFFLGSQEKFREAIAIGDVFLNPPRQGGGTGALFAIMESVPVITLDDCDVKANVGENFVCGSIDDMPSLVLKYFTDSEFMEEQKKNCRKRALERTNVDSEQNFQKLSNAVEKYAVNQESGNNDTI